MKDQAPFTAKQHQLRYSKAIQEAKDDGKQAFQAWFDASNSIKKKCAERFLGFFGSHFDLKSSRVFRQPHTKTALEIGHGGGRLLNAVCNYFVKAIGMDIHDQNDFVSGFFKGQGRTNFELIRTTGNEILVEGDAIDFLYSFIVLQHLPSYKVFKQYISEVSRVLKPGGIAQLCFGKFGQLRFCEQLKYWRQGYKEILDAEVNHTSLIVHPNKMKQLCRSFGLQVVDAGSSYKNVPNSYPGKQDNQNYVTVVRK